MQHLRGGGGRWVFKSPHHLEMLRPLFAAFPDAVVAQTHRDPVTSVVSLASLVTYGQRGNFDHPDPHLVGSHVADLAERLLRAAVADRAEDDPRFVDVPFAALVADPIGQARRVYRVADLPFDAAAERHMTAYLRRNAAKRARHRYAAVDFGLDVARLRERLAFYYDRFDVPRDDA